MLPHVVEINGNERCLCKERGFLVIKAHGECLGRIPMDDVNLLLVTGHGSTLSLNLLTALAERCVPVITCNAGMCPVSITLPLEGHHLQSRRMATQVKASVATQKRLWKTLVARKIHMQSQHLQQLGHKAEKLLAFSASVRSGDPDNFEASAASYYWPRCFGNKFRRQRDEPTVNALLNYAYAVLRAGTARALMLSGLHPAFGIFHRPGRNSMPLVDDIMEPFRPVADMLVVKLVNEGESTLTPQGKQFLVGVLSVDMETSGVVSPVFQSLRRAAASLAAVYDGTGKNIILPDTLLSFLHQKQEQENDLSMQVQDYVDARNV